MIKYFKYKVQKLKSLQLRVRSTCIIQQIMVKLVMIDYSTYVDDRGPRAEPTGNERLAWRTSDFSAEWKKRSEWHKHLRWPLGVSRW